MKVNEGGGRGLDLSLRLLKLDSGPEICISAF
jgi:hypothetical protein